MQSSTGVEAANEAIVKCVLAYLAPPSNISLVTETLTATRDVVEIIAKLEESSVVADPTPAKVLPVPQLVVHGSTSAGPSEGPSKSYEAQVVGQASSGYTHAMAKARAVFCRKRLSSIE